ncbi:hypothetical protein [Streptomyces enissocaesilis]|uniref:Uncharacterized protein n=1 Tax=Streptomyces enissocaesilis TaxID=332589 RepID=A0ABN3WW76_9ACTN
MLAETAQGHTTAAPATRPHGSQSALEKHTSAISDTLELPGNSGCTRRILASLRYPGI